MCVVSMVGDHYNDKWNPLKQQGTGSSNNIDWTDFNNPIVRKSDFDALKKEVEEMKELLKKAIAYDKKNNEPHCEVEDKIATLKKVAKMVGIDLDEIFKQ